MTVPAPTPIYRIIHIDNLRVCLERGGLHAPNRTPDDGRIYKTIHRNGIQEGRSGRKIDCGPGGTAHDYVAFYFGYLSPMLLQLKTGGVAGYSEGQDPIIYLVSTVQAVEDKGVPFVFSDGHVLPAYTKVYDDVNDLDKVDWNMVCQRYWADNPQDMDRQRRKQAEFLVHESCDWSLIDEIGVIDVTMKSRVESVLNQFPRPMHRPVVVHRDWYYW